jgi:quinol monooxygenase YgiN
MIKQPGCLSEQLPRRKNHPGEFISYSEWDSEESMQRHLESEDHKDIKRHNTNIKGVKVEVKHYGLVR